MTDFERAVRRDAVIALARRRHRKRMRIRRAVALLAHIRHA